MGGGRFIPVHQVVGHDLEMSPVSCYLPNNILRQRGDLH